MKIGWNQALLRSGNKQLLDEAEHDIKNYSKVRPDTQVSIIQTEVNVIC